jgi:hypothetical protein
MRISILEKFSEHHKGRIAPIYIFSSPVKPERDPDISDDDQQAFEDIITKSSKNQAHILMLVGTANARINQDKATLLAQASSKLKRSLCLLDCQHLSEKYIGETEKNLNRIFAEAESNNWILFFDEADALFGKRQKLKYSHDNNSTINPQHLLEVIMKHRGLLILSLSNKESFDTLKTRIKYWVNFH